MPSYVKKETTDILRAALTKLQTTTPITAIGPGSVARALAEVVIKEIGDFYSIMDFNITMGLLSSAQGRALDLIGKLYNVERKTLGEVATIDEGIGTFYFYIDTPFGSDITIPADTIVSTNATDYVSSQYSYVTTKAAKIPAGRLRVYAGIKPRFNDSVFTAGANTLVNHNFTSPTGTTVKCTNPKAVAPQAGHETDENYRLRIIKQIRASVGGTEEALRFAGLSVAGVRDVAIRESPYGLGTVEALVVPEDSNNAAQVLSSVSTKLATVRPAGVRLFLREPDYLSCDIRATILLRPNLNVDAAGIARRTEIGILRYMNTFLPGKPLIYSQLIQAALDSSDAIADVNITRFRIDGTEVLRRNYQPETDQQLIPGEIKVLSAP